MYQEILLFGKSIELYHSVTTIGQVMIFVWLLFHLKEYKPISTFSHMPEELIIKKAGWNLFIFKWIFPLLEVVIVFVILFAVSTPVTHGISYLFLGDRSDNYFYNIFVLPVGLLIFGLLLRISPLKYLDYVAPAMSLALIIFKIACFCWGCCNGVQDEAHGMFNHYTNRIEFPVQLVEIACAVVMFVIILTVRLVKRRRAGLLYPLFMIMYCALRFVSEFWRDDYPDILGPLKGYHIQCIIGFAEGIVLLLVVLIFGKRLTEYVEAQSKTILERFRKKEGIKAPSSDEQ